MKLKLKLLATILAVITLFTVLLPAHVYAIADPDSLPQIMFAYAYEDLLETGDMGFFVEFYLDYAAPPAETVTEAYLVVLIDTDGTTQIRAVSPYAYLSAGTNGYGTGVAWIYFTAADVTTLGLVGSSAYFVWLIGNPFQTWAGDPPKIVSGIDEWVEGGASLGTAVLWVADDLNIEWSPIELSEIASGNTTVLTTDGEAYFVNSIPNLRTIAPNIFAAGEAVPIQDDDVTAFGNTWAAQLVTDVLGTPLDMTDVATAFGTTRGWFSSIIWIVIMGMILLQTTRYLGVKISMVIFDLLVVFGGLLGMLPWALIVGLGILGIATTGFVLFYRPSGA